MDDLKQRTYRFFGPGSEYDTPLNDPYREKGGRFDFKSFLFQNVHFIFDWGFRHCINMDHSWLNVIIFLTFFKDMKK